MMSAKLLASANNRSATRRLRAAALSAVLLAACSRNKTNEEFYPRAEPIPVHVVNENFLDMNVAVISGGVSRRLGLVTGNSAGDFKIQPSLAVGQSVTLTATPIGGRGIGSSGALNVGPGQMIDFKIGSSLRQTTATVHEP